VIFEGIQVEEAVWKKFGETLAFLHKLGTPISDRDLLIASTAMVFDCTLVTNDNDFSVLPDDFVSVDNWALL